MIAKKEIVIVGGGITGLTATYYLQEAIKQRKLPYTITLIEASDKLGGKIATIRKQGFTIERGPDSFLIRKEAASRLAHQLGLKNELIKNQTGKSYVLVGDRLHEMPKGSFMGIPTKLFPFLLSPMFSLKGKVRMLCDLLLPAKSTSTDQSVGNFFRYHFGNELLENLIEPLLSGIYAGNIDRLSLMATFPQFYQMEQTHRSLIKGARRTLATDVASSTKKESKFYALKGGLDSLVKRLEQQFDPKIVQLLSATKVDHIKKDQTSYQLLLHNGDVRFADSVILTTSVSQAKRMFRSFNFWEDFGAITATSVANIAMAFDLSAIPTNLDGTGFVVSRNSDYRITACTWTHQKWPSTTPDNKALLRCYVGKPGDEAIVNLSDEEITSIALQDLQQVMGITEKPDFSVVTRWKHAMPQYTVGHMQRLESLEQSLKKQLPGVFVAGNSYRGIGLPDCIKQGEQVVDQVLTFFDEGR